jgi:hypothetical protein
MSPFAKRCRYSPFSGELMKKWFDAGRLSPQLLVKKAEESAESFGSIESRNDCTFKMNSPSADISYSKLSTGPLSVSASTEASTSRSNAVSLSPLQVQSSTGSTGPFRQVKASPSNVVSSPQLSVTEKPEVAPTGAYTFLCFTS